MKRIYLYIKRHPSYIYPTVLVLFLLLMTCLKINGSSIGIYHDLLYGQDTKDTSLVGGHPRQIRSDEWLVVTQTIIAQKASGFPRVNYNFNDGQDMSLISDAPYLEWSAVFKPQNFSFFILPLENAFALKWWFLVVLLALGTYFLSLRLLPKKTIVAVGLSVIASCSPFVFWWYQSTTILSLAYGILIILLGINIIDKKRLSLFGHKINPRYVLYGRIGALAYVLTAFALLLYPPFQIPIALVVGFFLLGYLLKSSTKKPRKYIISLILPLLSAVVIAASVCGIFIATRADVVHTISNTAYPGKRSVPSGGYTMNHLFVTYLQPLQVNNDLQNKYYTNQSEASHFVLLPLFFIAPLLYIIVWTYKKKREIDWIAIGLLVPTLLILTHLFLPFANIISKIFLLNLVPIERGIIGLGFVAIIIVMYIAKRLSSDVKLSKKPLIATAVYSLVFFIVSVYYGLLERGLYPELISSRKILILYALIVCGGMTLILFKKIRVGVVILALFSIYSVCLVHPIYQGLGPIYQSQLSSAIQEVSKPNDVWGVAEDIRFENVPQMSNRKAVTGVNYYPDLKFWDKYSESSDNTIYNRYAHIVLDKKTTSPILLVQKDTFVVSTKCERKLIHQIDFILSTSVISEGCLKLVKTVSYPKESFYIYRVSY